MSTNIHPCHWENCVEIFTSLPDLNTHINTSHLSKLSDVSSSFQCRWHSCFHSFQSKILLIRHIRQVHLFPNSNYQNYQMNYLPSQEMIYPYYVKYSRLCFFFKLNNIQYKKLKI